MNSDGAALWLNSPPAYAIGIVALGPVPANAAATRDPGDPLAVDLDVVRVVGHAVVAEQVDRLRRRDRVRGIADVGHDDRPAAGPVQRRLLLAVRRRRAAGPEVVAAVDAGRRMAGRK